MRRLFIFHEFIVVFEKVSFVVQDNHGLALTCFLTKRIKAELNLTAIFLQLGNMEIYHSHVCVSVQTNMPKLNFQRKIHLPSNNINQSNFGKRKFRPYNKSLTILEPQRGPLKIYKLAGPGCSSS